MKEGRRESGEWESELNSKDKNQKIQTGARRRVR